MKIESILGYGLLAFGGYLVYKRIVPSTTAVTTGSNGTYVPESTSAPTAADSTSYTPAQTAAAVQMATDNGIRTQVLTNGAVVATSKIGGETGVDVTKAFQTPDFAVATGAPTVARVTPRTDVIMIQGQPVSKTVYAQTVQANQTKAATLASLQAAMKAAGQAQAPLLKQRDALMRDMNSTLWKTASANLNAKYGIAGARPSGALRTEELRIFPTLYPEIAGQIATLQSQIDTMLAQWNKLRYGR